MPVPRNPSRVASLLQTGTALAALTALLLACSPLAKPADHHCGACDAERAAERPAAGRTGAAGLR